MKFVLENRQLENYGTFGKILTEIAIQKIENILRKICRLYFLNISFYERKKHSVLDRY